MKKNRKLLGGFVALLHICLIAFPLLVLGYNVAYRTIQSNQSYIERQLVSEEGNYQLVEYKTNELNSNDDIIIGNCYQLNTVGLNNLDWSDLYQISISGILLYYDISDFDISFDDYMNNLLYDIEHYDIIFETAFDGFDAYLYCYNQSFERYYCLDISNYGSTNFYGILVTHFENMPNGNIDFYTFLNPINLDLCVPKYELVEDNLTTTEVTYSFEDNSYLGLRDTLTYFYVLDSNQSLNGLSWFESYDELHAFPLLMDVDYLSVFSNMIGDSNNDSLNSLLAFLNFYFNWIINMSIVVFVPEMLIVFIDICRKLIYSFSHKIEGGY